VEASGPPARQLRRDGASRTPAMPTSLPRQHAPGALPSAARGGVSIWSTGRPAAQRRAAERRRRRSPAAAPAGPGRSLRRMRRWPSMPAARSRSSVQVPQGELPVDQHPTDAGDVGRKTPIWQSSILPLVRCAARPADRPDALLDAAVLVDRQHPVGAQPFKHVAMQHVPDRVGIPVPHAQQPLHAIGETSPAASASVHPFLRSDCPSNPTDGPAPGLAAPRGRTHRRSAYEPLPGLPAQSRTHLGHQTVQRIRTLNPARQRHAHALLQY